MKCLFTISKGFVSSEAEFVKSPIFCVCFVLILAQNRNLGLNPSSDIRNDRFISMKCFFTVCKGFVSSEAEFVKVLFFASVSCLSWPKLVI